MCEYNVNFGILLIFKKAYEEVSPDLMTSGRQALPLELLRTWEYDLCIYSLEY